MAGSMVDNAKVLWWPRGGGWCGRGFSSSSPHFLSWQGEAQTTFYSHGSAGLCLTILSKDLNRHRAQENWVKLSKVS